MNRFKKELRKHGFRLECDFDFLPCDGIETVKVDASKAIVSTYHVSAGWMHVLLGRDMLIASVRG